MGATSVMRPRSIPPGSGSADQQADDDDHEQHDDGDRGERQERRDEEAEAAPGASRGNMSPTSQVGLAGNYKQPAKQRWAGTITHRPKAISCCPTCRP